MKFRFKIQQYQTDAVDSVVRVFGGQPYLSGVTYVRDLGKREPKPATSPKEEQLSMLPVQPQEPEDDTGYKNDTVRLTSEELLANIRAIQAENNISPSAWCVTWAAALWTWKWKRARAKPTSTSKPCLS